MDVDCQETLLALAKEMPDFPMGKVFRDVQQQHEKVVRAIVLCQDEGPLIFTTDSGEWSKEDTREKLQPPIGPSRWFASFYLVVNRVISLSKLRQVCKKKKKHRTQYRDISTVAK